MLAIYYPTLGKPVLSNMPLGDVGNLLPNTGQARVVQHAFRRCWLFINPTLGKPVLSQHAFRRCWLFINPTLGKPVLSNMPLGDVGYLLTQHWASPCCPTCPCAILSFRYEWNKTALRWLNDLVRLMMKQSATRRALQSSTALVLTQKNGVHPNGRSVGVGSYKFSH